MQFLEKVIFALLQKEPFLKSNHFLEMLHFKLVLRLML